MLRAVAVGARIHIAYVVAGSAAIAVGAGISSGVWGLIAGAVAYGLAAERLEGGELGGRDTICIAPILF